ncbi:PiggyBac transposable element-derived protein 4 [Elysia marginata]|uniref:PiggyBac transposable element-derived protein 4 n=1 Tax=Elysia marginata TaxID=1093978 RepID=A0AAV4I9L1_9GAST|nr:PiggyBac transposable element-derived protein 4 [Elysia marginata]
MGDHSDKESLVLDSNAGDTSNESVDSDGSITTDPSQVGSESEDEGGVAAGVWLPILGEDNNTVPERNDPRYKTNKIQLLIDHFNHVFLYHYQPFQDISIDESLVGYKGKTPHLRQYMPNKHHARFGIKLWCLCDASNGYLIKFEVYKGAIDANERGPEGFTHNLCMRLLRTSNLLNRGYHVGLDNHFSSPALFLELFHQHQTTSTVRRNRKGLPAAVKKPSNLTNQQVCERRKGPLLAVAFKDGSKTPILHSTFTAAGYGTKINKRNQEIRKLKCVIKYNSSMGGVDLSDARLCAYLAERRTLKWKLKWYFLYLAGLC